MTFTASDYATTFGVYVLNGLAFLGIGLAVFYLKPDSRQSRALLAFGVVWGLYLVLDVDLFTAGRLHGLPLVLGALSPAAILHLGLTFPEPRAPVKQSGRPLISCMRRAWWLAWRKSGCSAAGTAGSWCWTTPST